MRCASRSRNCAIRPSSLRRCWTDGFAEVVLAERDRRDGVALGGRVMVTRQQPKGYPMSPLRQRMIEDMKLAGLSAGTQAIYIKAVRGLAAQYRRSPDQLGEEEVRAYLLGMRERGAARGTFKANHYGIQFFYRSTLNRDWALFTKKRSASPSRSGSQMRSAMPKSATFSLG